MQNQLEPQWIIEEYHSEDEEPIVITFNTYEEAYPFYVDKCRQNPTSLISIRKVDRKLLIE